VGVAAQRICNPVFEQTTILAVCSRERAIGFDKADKEGQTGKETNIKCETGFMRSPPVNNDSKAFGQGATS
jgi:hypothetical protein